MSADVLRNADEAAASGGAGQGVADPVLPCPLKLLALEVLVVDEDERAMPGVVAELRNDAGQALLGKGGSDGVMRFTGLEGAAYQLDLYALDAPLWSISSSEALEPSQRTGAPAQWSAPAVRGGRTATHQVLPGDCMIKLAYRYGLALETLSEHPGNAALKDGYRKYGILQPGDTVHIPDLTQGNAPVEAGMRYRVVCRQEWATLNLRFLDDDEQPRAGVAYLLSLQLADTGVFADRTGTTDENGALCERIPASAVRADLFLGQGAGMEAHEIWIGHVEPVGTVGGVQQRLNSLGYDCAEDEPGVLGAATGAALAAFQEDHGLQPSGELDEETRAAIEQLFDLS